MRLVSNKRCLFTCFCVSLSENCYLAMMNRIVYSLLLVMGALSCQARTPIRQIFAAMPDSVMPLLTKNNRLDFIDFLDCKMDAVVTNRLDGKSRMDMLTDDYLSMRYTSSCDVEMKLLPVNDSTEVLCMVTTLKAGVCDSRVDFYDVSWNPLPVEPIFMQPKLDDFRTEEVSDSAYMAWKKMDVYFKTYRLSPEASTLTCRLSTLDYLSKEDKELVLPYVKSDSIVFLWESGAFTAQ